jgi:F-type H+-transporting ATPase subunit gamma
MKWFADGKYDRVEIVYNQFLNAAMQINATEQFLPVEMEQKKKQKSITIIFLNPQKNILFRN